MSEILCRLALASALTMACGDAAAQFTFTPVPGDGVVAASGCFYMCSEATSAVNTCLRPLSVTAPIQYTVLVTNSYATDQVLFLEYGPVVFTPPMSTLDVVGPPGITCHGPTDNFVKSCSPTFVPSGATLAFKVTMTPPPGGFTSTNGVVSLLDPLDFNNRLCVSVDAAAVVPATIPTLQPLAMSSLGVFLSLVALVTLRGRG